MDDAKLNALRKQVDELCEKHGVREHVRLWDEDDICLDGDFSPAFLHDLAALLLS